MTLDHCQHFRRYLSHEEQLSVRKSQTFPGVKQVSEPFRKFNAAHVANSKYFPMGNVRGAGEKAIVDAEMHNDRLFAEAQPFEALPRYLRRHQDTVTEF